jgi:hypothetical protein
VSKDLYKFIFINLVIRGALFALLCYAAHQSGLDWGTFALGGFWGVGVFTYKWET